MTRSGTAGPQNQYKVHKNPLLHTAGWRYWRCIGSVSEFQPVYCERGCSINQDIGAGCAAHSTGVTGSMLPAN